MEQTKTASRKIKILLMRHAQSHYNKMQSDWKKENNLTAVDAECEEKRFINDPKLVDSQLSEEGVQQCKDAQDRLSEYNVTHVFSSPLRRAHITARIALEKHPKIDQISWAVNPWFRETIASCGDIGLFTSELVENYPDTDCSLVKDKKLWFLETWGIEGGNEHTKKMIEMYKQAPEAQTLLSYMAELSPGRVESREETRLRIDRAKVEVRNLIKEIEAKQGGMLGDN